MVVRDKRMSRRSVMAGAAGIPLAVPEGVLARRGRPGANDKIIYGHIGVGGMGRNHVVPDAAAAICDVDSNTLADVAKGVQGQPLLTNDFRRVLDRKDIDAVTIGTPDHWHAIMAVMACQSGKDVYSEKPTCRTILEGDAMINAARRYRRVVQIGAQGRSNSNAHAACNFVRNGQLGRVSHVEVWHENNWVGGYGNAGAPPSNLDWDMWLGPARWREYNDLYCPFNFRWMMDFGGGFIRDRGNHVLSVVMWCMGADGQQPVTVEATGEPADDGVWDVPVTMEVKWEFRDPDWTLTWSQPGARYSFPGSSDPISWGAKYHGSTDSLIVSGGDGGCDTEPKAKQYVPPADGFHAFLHPYQSDDALRRHQDNWRHCIRTRHETVMNPRVAVGVITLPILGNISYQLGRKLEWNAAEGRFVGDEEANRLLAEPYRAPWRL